MNTFLGAPQEWESYKVHTRPNQVADIITISNYILIYFMHLLPKWTGFFSNNRRVKFKYTTH